MYNYCIRIYWFYNEAIVFDGMCLITILRLENTSKFYVCISFNYKINADDTLVVFAIFQSFFGTKKTMDKSRNFQNFIIIL